MLDFLPTQLKQTVLTCLGTIYEVRIRIDKPVIVKGNNGLAVLTKEIELRDFKDSTREISPLRKADDAILLDTSDLTLEEVVNTIVEMARKKEMEG